MPRVAAWSGHVRTWRELKGHVEPAASTGLRGEVLGQQVMSKEVQAVSLI